MCNNRIYTIEIICNCMEKNEQNPTNVLIYCPCALKLLSTMLQSLIEKV
jgi:hypothetical protein